MANKIKSINKVGKALGVFALTLVFVAIGFVSCEQMSSGQDTSVNSKKTSVHQVAIFTPETLFATLIEADIRLPEDNALLIDYDWGSKKNTMTVTGVREIKVGMWVPFVWQMVVFGFFGL